MDKEDVSWVVSEAIQTFAQVMTEDYKSRNSKNINKNYNYKGTRR